MPPFPDEKNFNDYILVFPADSWVKPIYVYLKSARDKPGTAAGKGEVLSGTGKWLEAASTDLGAPVPAQVADKLRGKKLSNFDRFREAFWLAVAEVPELMSQFKRANQTIIRGGNVPISIPSEHVGNRFKIHYRADIPCVQLGRRYAL